jgi:hypothetical protein
MGLQRCNQGNRTVLDYGKEETWKGKGRKQKLPSLVPLPSQGTLDRSDNNEQS